nr:glycerol ethanol, ferric requiring protein [Polyrhizophydium stewartii]
MAANPWSDEDLGLDPDGDFGFGSGMAGTASLGVGIAAPPLGSSFGSAAASWARPLIDLPPSHDGVVRSLPFSRHLGEPVQQPAPPGILVDPLGAPSAAAAAAHVPPHARAHTGPLADEHDGAGWPGRASGGAQGTADLRSASLPSLSVATGRQQQRGVDGLPEPLRPSVATAKTAATPGARKSTLFDPISRRRRRELEARTGSLRSPSMRSPVDGDEDDGSRSALRGSAERSPSTHHRDSEAGDTGSPGGGGDDDEAVQDLMLPYEDFTTIDWMRDWMRDHRRKHRIIARRRPGWDSQLSTLFDSVQSWLLVSIIGIFIGIFASCIDIVAAWLTDVKQGVCVTEWYLSKDICCAGGYCKDFKPWSWVLFGAESNLLVNFVLYAFFSVVFAGACAVMVVRLCAYAAGSGTAEVKTILGGFIIKQFLGIRTLVVKSVALPLTVASGLAVGKEGPMIHIACCIGNIFPRMFPKYKDNEARKREILSGVAVAFGAPIGGVLFSLEVRAELSSFFPTKTMLRSFFCALVSCVTLQFIDPYRGKRVLFQVTVSRNWYFFEMVSFIILGVMGVSQSWNQPAYLSASLTVIPTKGLVGALVIRGNLWCQALRRRHAWLKANPIRDVLAIALVTATLGYINVITRPHLGFTIAALIFALLIKTALTIVSIGAKGVTKLTVSLTVVMFELTGTLNYIIPCMVTVMVAKLVGDLFGRGGMAEVMIRINRFPFLDPREDEIIGLPVSEAMTSIDQLVCFTGKGMTLSDIENMLDSHDFQGFPIITSNEDTSIVGYVTRDKARRYQSLRSDMIVYFDEPDFWSSSRADAQPRADRSLDAPAQPRRSAAFGAGGTDSLNLAHFVDQGKADKVAFCDKTPLGVDPTVPIELVMDLFKKLGPRVIIIKEAGMLRGLVTKKDLLTTIYSKEDLMASLGLSPGHATDILFADSAVTSARASETNLQSQGLLARTDSGNLSGAGGTARRSHGSRPRLTQEEEQQLIGSHRRNSFRSSIDGGQPAGSLGALGGVYTGNPASEATLNALNPQRLERLCADPASDSGVEAAVRLVPTDAGSGSGGDGDAGQSDGAGVSHAYASTALWQALVSLGASVSPAAGGMLAAALDFGPVARAAGAQFVRSQALVVHVAPLDPAAAASAGSPQDTGPCILWLPARLLSEAGREDLVAALGDAADTDLDDRTVVYPGSVSAALSSTGQIVRMGGVVDIAVPGVAGHLHFRSISSEPVKQGIVSKATAIMIVKMPEPHATLETEPTVASGFEVLKDDLNYDEGTQALLFDAGIDPAGQLILSSIKIASAVIRPRAPVGDINSRAVSAPLHFLTEAGLCSGDWIWLSHGNGHKQLVCVEAWTDSGNAAITGQALQLCASPLVIRNLVRDATWQDCLEGVEVRAPIEPVDPAALPCATQLTLARVATPTTSDRALFEASLTAMERFFSTDRRIVAKGDWICVQVDGESCATFQQRVECLTRNHVW